MKNIPDKCSRCGAPIDWEKGASSIKCSFCGKTNYLTNNYLNEFKNYLKLRDPKKIIRNPFSFILVLPIIFLFLILNSPIKKQEKIKAEYWPTNWDKLKQTKFKGGTFPADFDKSEKDSHTVKFKSDIVEACKYRNELKKELENFELNRDKSLYEFNIQVGNIAQFDFYPDGLGTHPILYTAPEIWISPYLNPDTSKYQTDKAITIQNFERINRNLKNEGKKYWDYYERVHDNSWRNQVSELSKIIDLQNNKIFASFIEVKRQMGDKNWKLYSRWGLFGIGDLYDYYFQKFKISSSYKKIYFGDWLLKKGILDKTHMNKLSSGNFVKYRITIVEEGKINRICEMKN